ncbi:oxamate carbamoyltransferase subunit AllH family protein [Streptomyces boluensis]|uniref:DUF2877 domain-containing protein n=1 Tax=Streptomyces boluensis TaxID=1775135 RepID=A0A964UWH3_9ACTN|nr:DUF2877 domain-containing protein [Streptomyces boluensis]NBE55543.1 DUF2877 domain-containing protein [Streptomyces boluensis]
MSPTAPHCAASTLTAAVVHGPPRPARVVAATRGALYLLVRGSRTPLALLAPDAVRVPAAVVLPAAAGDRPFAGLGPGRAGRVGGGRIAVGPLCLTAGVSWAPPRAQDTPPGRALDVLAALPPPRPLPPGVRAAAAQTVRALAYAHPGAVRRSAARLLGLGPGLTPSGDDFLCGLLLAAHLAPYAPPWLGPLAALAARAEGSTPLVSAALLRHAATGHCVPQAAALLRAAATGTGLVGPLAALLAVGHSSGGDLLQGLCAGARVLSAGTRVPCATGLPGVSPKALTP